jgi:hypothetical protein
MTEKLSKRVGPFGGHYRHLTRPAGVGLLGVLPKGILTPSFIEIAPAVTKRSLLTDGQYIVQSCRQIN